MVTLGAPIIAEIPNRLVPVGLMFILNVIALIAAYFLRLKVSSIRASIPAAPVKSS